MSEWPSTPEGFTCEGTHTIVARDRDTGHVAIFVARASMRGRPWLRFVRKIGAVGWWVTGHAHKRDAL